MEQVEHAAQTPLHTVVSDFKQRIGWYISVRWLFLASVALPNLILQFLLPSANIPVVRNLLITIAFVVYNLFFIWALRHIKHKRSLTQFAIFQIILDVVTALYLVFTNGGIESHAVMLLIIPILCSGVLWSKFIMHIVAGLVGISYSVLVTLMLYGIITGPISTEGYSRHDVTGFASTLMFIVSILQVIAFIGGFIINLLRHQSNEIKHARHKASELAGKQIQDAEADRVRTEALIDSIGEGLIVVNEYGNVTDLNIAAEHVLGYKKEEMLGKWWPEAVKALDVEGKIIGPIDRPLVKALETGKPVSRKLAYVSKKGEAIPVFQTAAPFLIGDKPAGGVIVFRDNSQEIKIEQAKDEFISIVSHQLRTPLTAIRLFTEMILQGQVGSLKPEQTDYLNKIEESTIRMIQLVGTILNVSRIEMGRLKVTSVPTSLVQLIDTWVAETKPLADEKKVKIVFRSPRTAIPEVNIDPSLIGEVIHNLLTNAIRYSPGEKGVIEIDLTKDQHGYLISVKDNGIGIPEHEKPKIFTRFYRAQNAVAAVGEGTGLGLYLVKMITKQAGGKVWFESKEGKGTTFYVRIPSSGMKSKAGDRSLASGGKL